MILVVVALSFVALGVANVVAGWEKMNEYRVRKHEAIAIGGESVKLPFAGTPSILDPSTDAQLLYEGANIKYKYYRTVRRGGFYFLGIGSALLLWATIRAARDRRRMRSAESGAG